MGRKRTSFAGEVSAQKHHEGNKRRRDSDPTNGSPDKPQQHTSKSLGDSNSNRRSSSTSSGKEMVLQCAPQQSTSPLLVSFANLTIPPDIDTLKFALHAGQDAKSKEQRVVMGEGRRWDDRGGAVSNSKHLQSVCTLQYSCDLV